MIRLTSWREAVTLPVIGFPARWSSRALERVLTNSIHRCARFALRRDGAIATTLSGGLDSSFCLAKIRETCGEKIMIFTFTIGGNESHPDVKHARIISKMFKTIHVEIIPKQEHLIEAETILKKTQPSVTHGDIAVFLAYQKIASHDFRIAISHDGIDELLGGYWDHRKALTMKEKKAAFVDRWARLSNEHLLPLEASARHFDIGVALPYLQREVVRYISRIPLNKRTSKEESKIPLREIARKYLPIEIIERKKMGFCSALDD
ncbi:MAG: asparagine synthase C-terminal domain-containing protein [Patescibacteria group bacterium]